ncbi:MAG: hypothetical protein JWQ40_358 [Segetibacter sp.]|nr:hypothetical protein [Segetibacter sp.]
MSLVIENQLFPCVDYIKKVIKTKYVKLEQCESFQKMSFRNRYIIAGANGITSLTIPVAGGREQKQLIKEVQIDYTTNWNTIHWRSICSAYSKAPFFDYYASDIKNLIFSEEKKLFTLNINILDYILKTLNINTLIEYTSSFQKDYIEEVDCRNEILPKNFQTNRENWTPKYSQVFEDRLGFQPNLSILDLLFCEGPNAIHLLNSSVK